MTVTFCCYNQDTQSSPAIFETRMDRVPQVGEYIKVHNPNEPDCDIEYHVINVTTTILSNGRGDYTENGCFVVMSRPFYGNRAKPDNGPDSNDAQGPATTEDICDG